MSTQLEKLEKDLQVYAKSNMNQYVADALKNLKHYDFDKSVLAPCQVNPGEYTTYTTVITPASGSTSEQTTRVANINKGKKALLLSIQSS